MQLIIHTVDGDKTRINFYPSDKVSKIKNMYEQRKPKADHIELEY